MPAFARITLDYAVELVTARIENGEGSPTDAEIAAHCGIDEPAQVRSLLADLSDAGRITIRGTGADRQLMIGRQAKPFTPAPRPIPSAFKRTAAGLRVDPDQAAFDKIRAAIDRGKAAVGPQSRNTPEASGTARKAPSGPELTGRSRIKDRASSIPVSSPAIPPGEGDEGAQRDDVLPIPIAAPQPVSPPLPAPKQGAGEGVQVRGPHRDEPAPQSARVEPSPGPAPKLEMARLPTGRALKASLPVPTRKQVNISLPGADYLRMADMARAAGMPASTYAADMVLAALNGEMSLDRLAPPAKVRVPAHITAAAVREGVPVTAFVADLIERGFHAWRTEFSLERCA